MTIIVQKFGGTSVADLARIENVAKLILKERANGNQVVVVVSAMATVTNSLVDLAKKVSSLTNNEQLAEYDSILSTGEQISSALLSLLLQSQGIKARSWLGWQIPILTNDTFSKARIENIKIKKIKESLEKDEIPIIAGFQAVTHDERITTIGRGGSDTTAVAVAAALKADRCDIYTDVDGVFTADPRIVNTASKLDKISYEEMLELASLGAKVLHTRSVVMAMKHGVLVRVLSSFNQHSGTILTYEDKQMEQRLVTAITCTRDEARITLSDMPKTTDVSAVFGLLADKGINLDMIVQNISKNSSNIDVTFTSSKADLSQVISILEQNKHLLKFANLSTDPNVSKVSAVGVGMLSHAGVAREMFQALAEKSIDIIVISTSEIKISVLIPEEYMELAVRTLHTTFKLDRNE
jgi:aspartate kinase